MSNQQLSYDRTSWERLGKEAKRLEAFVEAKLVPSVSYDGHTINETLIQLHTTIESMRALISGPAGGPDLVERHVISTTAHHLLQRHQELFETFVLDAKRAERRSQLQTDKFQLLYSPNSSTTTDHSLHSSPFPATHEYWMEEHSRIEGTHGLTDHVLGIALQARSRLSDQRQWIQGGFGKLLQSAQRYPSIANAIKAIRTRQVRDQVIFGVVIAVCTLVLLWMWFR